MSKLRATPGPWKLEARRDICDEFECWLHPINLHIHDKISDEDAHLIAAAPRMYDALLSASRVFRMYEEHHALKGAMDKAEANGSIADDIEKLLAEARGEG